MPPTPPPALDDACTAATALLEQVVAGDVRLPAVPDVDADLADACAKACTVADRVSAAIAVLAAAVTAGKTSPAEAGRLRGAALGRLEADHGRWGRRLADLPARRFDMLLADPDVAPYAAGLRRDRDLRRRPPAAAPERPPVGAMPPGQVLSQLVGPAAAATSTGLHAVDGAVRADAERRRQEAVAGHLPQLASSWRHLLRAAALAAGSPEQHLQAITGAPAALLDAAVEQGAALAGRSRRAVAIRAGGGPPRLCDRYAPVGTPSTWTVEQAAGLARRAAGLWHPSVAAAVEVVLEHVPVQAGPDLPSRCVFTHGRGPLLVQVAFDGTWRGASTFVHEVGHAAHALLAAAQPMVSFAADRPIAEAAATTLELFAAHLHAQAATHRGLLLEAADTWVTAVVRQALSARFERRLWAAALTGDPDQFDALARQQWQLQQHAAYGTGPAAEDLPTWPLVGMMWSQPGMLSAYALAGQIAAALVHDRVLGDGGSADVFAEKALPAGSARPVRHLLEMADVGPGRWADPLLLDGLLDRLT